MDDADRRANYRIRYPLAERPEFIVENQTNPVIDVSSGGIRYLLAGASLPPLGSSMQGKLRFRRGAEVDIRGVVVRAHGKEVALSFFDREIPFMILWDEQRYLHSHYPMWS